MPIIDRLWLATLTKGDDDAGTGVNALNVTININGEDVADMDFGFMSGSGLFSGGQGPDEDWLGENQAALSGGTYNSPGEVVANPFEGNLLTNSSIRLGIRDDDAWGPKHVLLLGQTQPGFVPSQIVALAMETEVERWLSTDSSEGKLTMPLRLVGPGNANTLIRRVMLLAYTDSTGGTDSPIQVQVTAAGNLVLQQQIPDTEQDDLEDYMGNSYFVDAAVPFTRGDVVANGGIRLSLLGTDAWLPKTFFLFGLDTAAGRPNEVVHLVSIPQWNLGALSANQPSIPLPVS